MRRALRWLGRQLRRVLLLGVLAFGVALALLAAPGMGFAEPPQQGTRVESQQQMPSGGPLTPREIARARERARTGRLLFLGSQLYEGALLAGFLLLGGTRWLAGLAARFGGRWLWAAAAVFGIIAVGGALLTLPLDYYSGYTFQHQYGLSNQTPLQWFRDYLVGNGVQLAFGLPLIWLLYLLLRRAPRTWWLWLGAASAPLAVFFMLIVPVFVEPLFNKFTPLQNQSLREQLLTMAHAQGIPAHDVYQMDASRQSNAVNAYVNGVGPTQRIVLYDTLLRYFTPDEIKFVMAHEMGHYVLGHIWKGIIISVLSVFLAGFLFNWMGWGIISRYGTGLGVDALGNPAGLPVLMALSMVLTIVSLPIGNAISRHFEQQADDFALRVDPDIPAGVSAYHKLARLNVAEEDPPRWAVILLSTHPSLGDRIRHIEAYGREHEGQ